MPKALTASVEKNCTVLITSEHCFGWFVLHCCHYYYSFYPSSLTFQVISLWPMLNKKVLISSVLYVKRLLSSLVLYKESRFWDECMPVANRNTVSILLDRGTCFGEQSATKVAN